MRIDARHLFLIAMAGYKVYARGTLVKESEPTSPAAASNPTTGTGTGSASPTENASGPTTVNVNPETGAEPFIYVSTESTLYSFAPQSRTWKVLANLSASCPYAYELAIDSKSDLYSASNTLRTIYKFDATFDCTQIPRPNIGDPWDWTLSFVPKNVFGNTADTIVGYAYRNYYRILPNGGTILVTSNALDPQMYPNGNIISMDDRAFVTVTGSSECSPTDCLLEIAPKDGTIVKNWGTFPKKQIWAMAHTAGKLYGFRDNNEVYEMTLAEPLVVQTLPGPGVDTIFSGASSSTAAPTQ